MLELGVNEVISLLDQDEHIIARIKELHHTEPINTVVDYIWGHPAELVLTALRGGGLHNITPKVRFVTVGSMAGEEITLTSGLLRSSAVEILGSGFGSVPADVMAKLPTEILPEMLQLAAEGKLKVETVIRPLSEIETAWNEPIPTGKRLVIVM